MKSHACYIATSKNWALENDSVTYFKSCADISLQTGMLFFVTDDLYECMLHYCTIQSFKSHPITSSRKHSHSYTEKCGITARYTLCKQCCHVPCNVFIMQHNTPSHAMGPRDFTMSWSDGKIGTVPTNQEFHLLHCWNLSMHTSRHEMFC